MLEELKTLLSSDSNPGLTMAELFSAMVDRFPLSPREAVFYVCVQVTQMNREHRTDESLRDAFLPLLEENGISVDNFEKDQIMNDTATHEVVATPEVAAPAPSSPSMMRRIRAFFAHPATQIVGGVVLAAGAGYAGYRYCHRAGSTPAEVGEVVSSLM